MTEPLFAGLEAAEALIPVAGRDTDALPSVETPATCGPTLALIIDTETSSPDAATCELVEVGAVLYDLELASVVACLSTVVAAPGGNAAEAINGVPDGMVRYSPYVPSREVAMEPIVAMARKAKYVIAHNAKFDRAVLAFELGDCKWVCSYEDVKWPSHVTSLRLVDVALQMGVGVVRAHRALEDCLTLAAVFDRIAEGGMHLPLWIEDAATARWVRVVAHVTYGNNDLAKAAGFRWDAVRKEWWRRVRDTELAEVRAHLAEVRVLCTCTTIEN